MRVKRGIRLPTSLGGRIGPCSRGMGKILVGAGMGAYGLGRDRAVATARGRALVIYRWSRYSADAY
ncbi:MAG: hypothetical protein AUK55_07510 [Syntrophobacteraceae bacterium CG2_30_61_12]|nr:MAG: hypothetical protein AUK55_07510 [Syntrophobacteraceae bacterium CG2_30_61_12]